MAESEPIGYIVYWPRRSSIPSILADANPDGGGTIYVKQAAVDRLAELRSHGFDDYRMAAVVPVEVEPDRPEAEAVASGSGALYACVPTKDTEENSGPVQITHLSNPGHHLVLTDDMA